jgi:hypothetical protein
VAITIEDIFGQSTVSGGGLRGGSWALHGTRVVFENTVDVPGVALSGSIKLQRHLTGHITVQGYVQGTLTLRGKSLSGTLNGAEVQARLSD